MSQATLQECRDHYRAVLNQCEDDLIVVGVLSPAEVTKSAQGDDSSPDQGETTVTTY